MSVFKELLKDVGENIKEYSKTSLNMFVEVAKKEISGLSNYYVLGEKEVSILRNNLPYIQHSVDIVKGLDGNSKAKGKKSFTYYDKNGEKVYDVAGEVLPAPLLADPENDKGGDPNLRDVLKIIVDNRAKRPRDYQIGAQTEELKGLLKTAYWPNNFHDYEPNLKVVGGVEVHRFINEYETGNTKSFINKNALNYGYNRSFESYIDPKLDKSLVTKTLKWFRKAYGDECNKNIQEKFKTIISRFKTDPDDKGVEYSHGRNLRNKKTSIINDYDNPYCRVWTWHHQYSRYINDTMRPLLNAENKPITQEQLCNDNDYNWKYFRSNTIEGFGNGADRLSKYGAMYDNGGLTNGLVNITPSWEPGTKYDSSGNVNLKHCMFSIENLAWKGMFNSYDERLEAVGLSREQKGPMGGRIMWFPPYDLSFNEQSNARWEENNFIGRGEPIYTYSNTSRSGTLHFKLLIDHPAILDYWEGKNLSLKEDGDANYDVEEQLLRFFAGCEILETGKHEEPKPDPVQDPVPDPVPREDPNYILVPVFFPNNYSGVDDIKANSVVDPILYLLNGVVAQKGKVVSDDKTIEVGDIPTTDKKITVEYMRDLVSFPESGATVGGYETRKGMGVSLLVTTNNLNSNNDSYIGTVKYADGKEYELFKEVDPNTKKKSKKKEWAYRVDKAYVKQNLEKIDSYYDTTSYQLNSLGCYGLASKNLFYTTNYEKIFSLVDLYVALHQDTEQIFSEMINKERVEILKSILDGTKGSIRKIECTGDASLAGYGKFNKDLGIHRAQTLEWWLKKEFKDIEVSSTKNDYEGDKNDDLRTKSKNGESSWVEKFNRRAVAKIYITPIEVKDASETNIVVDENGTPENNSSVVNTLTGGEKTENRKTSTESQARDGNLVQNADGELKGANSNLRKVVAKATLSNYRYDNEARFFQKLKANDPLVHKLISDKIKFFNPAFHSITPEGFNSRLTFLNQCMRQGPTYSGSDSGGKNTNNLSFGRPPVCVLRIGDFYNTKIIVTNLTINYDPLTWDLNQEGIGVMPMIADVSLSFNFVGGSEMGGPIQRLQNAISFNYYANTSVYDNRAERIEYGDFGKVDKFKAYDLSPK